VAFTTMRRGAAGGHVFETIDSILPFLGGAGTLHISLTVVDVERGAGEFAREIEAKYAELVKTGLLTVKYLDEEARASLYEGLVKVRKMFVCAIML
jgi:hypothetical protein